MRAAAAVLAFLAAVSAVHSAEDKPAAADPPALDAGRFVTSSIKVSTVPTLTTFAGPISTANCTAVEDPADWPTPASGSFGNCSASNPLAGGCGCLTAVSSCPNGSSMVSCSGAQYPVERPGADWNIGTNLVKPEENRCVVIWVNTVPNPRPSVVKTSAICSKVE